MMMFESYLRLILHRLIAGEYDTRPHIRKITSSFSRLRLEEGET